MFKKKNVLSDEEFAVASVSCNRYYLSSGKAVCMDEIGKIQWYGMEFPQFFKFGEAVESNYLLPGLKLTKSDLIELEELKTLNQVLDPVGLFAIAFEPNEPDNVIIIHQGQPDTCFMASVNNIKYGKFNQIAADSMLDYIEERPINEPLIILEFHDNGILAY